MDRTVDIQVLNDNHFAGSWENKVKTDGVGSLAPGAWNMGVLTLSLGVPLSPSPTSFNLPLSTVLSGSTQ